MADMEQHRIDIDLKNIELREKLHEEAVKIKKNAHRNAFISINILTITLLILSLSLICFGRDITTQQATAISIIIIGLLGIGYIILTMLVRKDDQL